VTHDAFLTQFADKIVTVGNGKVVKEDVKEETH